MTEPQVQDTIHPVEDEEAPPGFSIICFRTGPTVTWTLYEGRTPVAENLTSPGEARKLAKAFRAHSNPVVGVDPYAERPLAPVTQTKAFDLRTNIYVPIPQAAHNTVLKLIRDLTETTLVQLAHDTDAGSKMHFTAADQGDGNITVTATTAETEDPEVLEKHYHHTMSSQILKGRLLTQAEANALKILEEAQMDPLVKDTLIKMIVRLLPYS